MRLVIALLGTEIFSVTTDEAPRFELDTSRHSGAFEIGFTGPPTSRPLPSDVEMEARWS